VKSHFELSPAEYERQRQGHLHDRRVALVAADVAARVRPGDLVLELGCGPGDVLAALAAAHPEVRFLGVDIDASMIEHARAAHAAANVEFRLLDLSTQRANVRGARVVFGIDVLHHVDALGELVGAVAALLEPGGVWTVIEPNSRNPYIWLHQERMRRAGLDETHFRRDALEREAARHGLRVLGRTTAFLVPGFVQSVPRPVAWAERRLERVPLLGGSVVYRLAPTRA
jgi:trans-aconitate methyltransferase